MGAAMAGLPPFAAARPLLLRLLLLLKRARRARRWQSTDSHPVAIACRPAGGRGVHECLAGMRRFGQTIVASGKCAPCQPVTWPGCATPAPASGWGELYSASTSGRLWTIWYVGRKKRILTAGRRRRTSALPERGHHHNFPCSHGCFKAGYHFECYYHLAAAAAATAIAPAPAPSPAAAAAATAAARVVLVRMNTC